MHGPGCKYLRLKKDKNNMSQKKEIEKVLVILRLFLIENLTSVDSDFKSDLQVLIQEFQVWVIIFKPDLVSKIKGPTNFVNLINLISQE